MDDVDCPPVVLGIDTGGTYTDAVLMEPDAGVLASAKALTTPGDLSVGISGAIGRLDPRILSRVRRVCLSTTLATNAIVEGRGARVFLILLGHDTAVIERFGLASQLPDVGFAVIPGRMSQQGEEVRTLDTQALRELVAERTPTTDAFAISGYFAVKNPAHEQAAREIVEQASGRDVVCGHELSSKLDCIRRAATAVLNARLLPVVRAFTGAVREALDGLGQASLGCVEILMMRGDGSLMTLAAAQRRPIETILSGPAASVAGARRLAGEMDALVIDMGGTTTDMAVISDGEPKLEEAGADVGGCRTHVRACDMETMGLGGDSHVRLGWNGKLLIGPRRVIPLGLLAGRMGPRVMDGLRAEGQRPAGRTGRLNTDFIVPEAVPDTLVPTQRESALLECLRDGPRDLVDLARELGTADASLLPLDRLEASGAVRRAGLTPTDLLVVTGRLNLFAPEASALAAEQLADRLGISVEALCSRVVGEIQARVAAFALRRGLRWMLPKELPDATVSAIVEGALARPDPPPPARLRVELSIPLVAIGAPVAEYMPGVAQRLGARLVIPDSADVANAVGAAVGTIRRTIEIDVRPVYEGAALSHYVVHSQVEKSEWPSLAEAVDYAEQLGTKMALADLAGAAPTGDGVHVVCGRAKSVARAGEEGAEILMGITVRATAWVADAFATEPPAVVHGA